MINNDWVCITEDLPQIENGYKAVSVEVLCKCDNGEIVKGFYAHHTHKWYNEHGRRIKADVIAWQSM